MNHLPTLISRLRDLEQASRSFVARDFVKSAQEDLRQFPVNPKDISDYLSASWDTMSCLPHPVDTDEPPFLIDLHVSTNWSLRATLWPPTNLTDWVDVFHSHFGYIATTAVTPIAYHELLLRSFQAFPSAVSRRELRKGQCHFLEPETIHKIILPDTAYGLSLSVRSRAVNQLSAELDERTGAVVERTKSADDRSRAVQTILSNLTA